MSKYQHVRTELRHEAIEPGFDLSWDDVRVFLLTADLGSFRAVSLRSGVAQKTISRQIDDLERLTGAVLLNRSRLGVSLTEEGVRIAEMGRAMLRQAGVLADQCRRQRQDIRQPVRIGITEGLGAFWLTPRVVDLYVGNPGLQVDLRCSMTAPDTAGLEVDLAVQLEPPSDPDLVVTRLGWLHIVLFASKHYVSLHGAPASKADLSSHQVIEFVADQVRVEALRKEIPNRERDACIGLRVNTSSAQVLACAHGAGVSALPTYAPLVTGALVQVAPDFYLRRDLWLTYHARSAEQPHVRRTIDWVRRSFDPVRYPWFAEKLMPPAEIERYMNERGMDSLFATFSEAAKPCMPVMEMPQAG